MKKIICFVLYEQQPLTASIELLYIHDNSAEVAQGLLDVLDSGITHPPAFAEGSALMWIAAELEKLGIEITQGEMDRIKISPAVVSESKSSCALM